MGRVKITKRFIVSCSARSKDVLHRDSELPGFGIKVSPRGTISFVAEGRIKSGSSMRVTLGNTPPSRLNMPVARRRRLSS